MVLDGLWRYLLLISLTLAITWPQEVLNEEENLAVAAQVHGDVREHRAKVVNHP